MKWHKLGLVFCPDGRIAWMRTHAANPTPYALGNGHVRVYFSARDSANRSSIGWIEIDLRDPTRVIHVSARPALGPGGLGAFDEDGASVGCVVQSGSERRLYYLGWNLGRSVPWRNSIGVAIGEAAGDSFTRYAEGPILDRSPADPYSLSYPFVLRADNGSWHMWYGSNLGWGSKPENMRHVIKHARSEDGIEWRRRGHIAIDIGLPSEIGLSRPWVVNDRGLLRMWYSFRAASYRIGYAESADGEHWQRKDSEAGIEPAAESAWDSGSVEYPAIVDDARGRYLLYNGEGYGRTGFGIAVLDQD